MKTALSVCGLSVALGLMVLSGQAYSNDKTACSNLKAYKADSSNITIASAEFYENRRSKVLLPPHCHVEGEIDPRTGADGKHYALKFALNLPEKWSGRYLFQGGGGLNGTLNEPLGDLAAGDKSALERGFAVVSTDSGHQGQIFDGSFFADQEAALNFFFLGNMRVTIATKPIVEAYYKKDIQHSYFMGCSTGGREGMIMSQRYPYLYDGIVSGAPAIRTGLSNLALRWLNVQLNQAAPKDENGLPLPGGTFNKSELKLIVDGLIKQCDGLDGVEDHLIFNTAACHFDPMSLACAKNEKSGCLAKEKAQALVKAVAGPVDSRGVQVYSRFMYDTGFDDHTGYFKGLIAGGGVPPVGPRVDTMMSQDVDAEFIAATAPDAAIGDTMSLNLSSFVAHGGKQIFYHGLSDPWFSAMDTLNYYQQMAARNGGPDKADSFSRIFLFPGMGHCGGGEETLDHFDMLSAIVDWVEKDQAPNSVVATGQSMPGVSRPVCPYPQYPHYKGKGDKNVAANFECKL